MRNNEPRFRQFCISVCNESCDLLCTLPLVVVDDTMSGLAPETRALWETCCERRRGLAEALYSLRKTVQQSRAMLARSRRKPYLAAADGDAVL